MSVSCCAGRGCSACAAEADVSLAAPVADPIKFRHGAIKARMLDEISATQIDDARPLARLGTRDDADPAIALIDAYACSLHVLARNIGRLFADGTLPGTEDRDALVDLTHLLGYAPRPAISATTVVAFTLDDLDVSPKVAQIPKGMKIASVPGQDEKPQTFETDAAIEARAEWNTLRPVRTPLVPPVSLTTTSITIAGAATLAKPGDVVLVYREPQGTAVKWLSARVTGVTREAGAAPPRTRLDLTSRRLVGAPAGFQGPAFRNQVILLAQRAAAFGATAPDLELMSDSVRQTQIPSGGPTTPLPTEWKDLTMDPSGTKSGGSVDLDAIYPDALAGRAVLFSRLHSASKTQMGSIDAVTEGARKGFGLAAKTSRITVSGIDLRATGFRDRVRDTVIYLETGRENLLVLDEDVELPLAATPDRIVVVGETALPVGRKVVLSGEPWSAALGSGEKLSEVATLASSSSGGGTTELVFEAPLVGRFHAASLSLFANCVSASHGETPSSGVEYIGSGKATVETPRFPLKSAPLAHVPAAGPRGYAAALEVRVGERLYTEEATIFGKTSEDRAYMVRDRRDGTAEVQFAGRLPTGTNNVTALYRKGGGQAGNLEAGRLTSMLSPVLGVKSASNVIAASGGSDPETVDDLRRAAPKSIRTLDRAVSLGDFEAFAEGYRGVGKALATELRDGMRSVVCLTIATTDLLPPVAGSDLVTGLASALAAAAVPGRHVRIEGFLDLTATLVIALAIDPAFRRSDVEAAARGALARDFDRRARAFGQGLPRSAVLVSVQGVTGVIAARIDVFTVPGGPPESAGRLLCPVPKIEGGVFSPAGLLSVVADAVTFTEMQP